LVLGEEGGQVEIALLEESRIVLNGVLSDVKMNRPLQWNRDLGGGDCSNGVEEVWSWGEAVVGTWDDAW
jgi:hypothetical protein